MKKAMIVTGVVFGGFALFMGVTLFILKVQGRMEGENLRTLSTHPLLGAFVPTPPPLPENPGEGRAEDGSGGDGSASPWPDTAGASGRTGPGSSGDVPLYLNAPKSFSQKELRDLLETARESKVQSEKERMALEVERADLGRLRDDLAERKAELERSMSDLAAAKTEFDVAREAFRKEITTIEENEEKNIRKLAELYENMKPEDASKHFNDMDQNQAVKIIMRMDSAKMAKIFPYIDADRVKVLTEKLARFQERERTETKR